MNRISTTKIATAATRQIPAVVVSAGLMDKTVKVRIGVQQWNAHIRKKFNKRQHLLVHDPRSSLREGDIISISPGWRASKHVHHVVSSIIAPFGEPIEARPAVPSEEERMKEREEKLRLKNVRRGKIADINAEDGDGSRALGEDGIDGREVKTTDEVLSGVQEAREEVREVKGVSP